MKIARDIIFDKGSIVRRGATLETISKNNKLDNLENIIISNEEPIDYSSFFRKENVLVNSANQAID
jgi:hypothetical protein